MSSNVAFAEKSQPHFQSLDAGPKVECNPEIVESCFIIIKKTARPDSDWKPAYPDSGGNVA